MTKLTASEYVKLRGLPSVAYVAGKINEHPQRLFEWYNDNFEKFETTVAGILMNKLKQQVKENAHLIGDQVVYGGGDIYGITTMDGRFL